MSTADEQINVALDKLDPSNDDQWTTDGLPTVEIMKELTGNTFLNRAAITVAHSGFNRAVAAENVAKALTAGESVMAPVTPATGQTGDNTAVGVSTALSPSGVAMEDTGATNSQVGTSTANTTAPAPELEPGEDDADEAEEEGDGPDKALEAEIQEGEEYQNQIRRALDEGQKELVRTTNRLATLYAKRDLTHESGKAREAKLHNSIQNYFAAQDAAKGNTNAKSRLDQSMERKKGFGNKRPTFTKPTE